MEEAAQRIRKSEMLKRQWNVPPLVLPKVGGFLMFVAGVPVQPGMWLLIGRIRLA
jgi:hypothetical protein